MNSKLKKLLREPLLHFLLIGAVLFFIYDIQNEDIVDNNHIVISEAQINHLITLWKKKRLRAPTETELESMIEQQVREEVLYREAIAMKLDQDDGIIRRRLAQKIEFISADLATLAEPSETQLTNYLTAHREKFEQPARINFVQVYIDINKHGANIESYTHSLLHKLTQAGSNANVAAAGDSLMLDQQYQQLTEQGVSRLFGKNFANELFALPAGNWQGPVQSGYGLHLVRIDRKTEPQLPTLNTVRKKVQAEWLSQQRREMNKIFYASLRQRYKIIIENTRTKNTTDNKIISQKTTTIIKE